MKKIVYTSLCFTNADGTPRKFLVPKVALPTYLQRDAALAKCMSMGGIYAELTPTYLRFRKIHLSASRKIRSKSWFCESVSPSL